MGHLLLRQDDDLGARPAPAPPCIAGQGGVRLEARAAVGTQGHRLLLRTCEPLETFDEFYTGDTQEGAANQQDER